MIRGGLFKRRTDLAAPCRPEAIEVFASVGRVFSLLCTRRVLAALRSVMCKYLKSLNKVIGIGLDLRGHWLSELV